MKDLIIPPVSPWEIGEMNIQLKKYFGYDFDRPKYRIAWANHQEEDRCGTYNEFYGPLFLRTVTGFKRVFKYPMFKNRYIFERILFYPQKEVIGSENGTYESVYCFQDKDNNYLPPLLDKAMIIAKFLEAPKVKLSESDYKEFERLEFEKEVEEIYTRLQEVGYRWMFYPGETGRQGVFMNSSEQKAWSK